MSVRQSGLFAAVLALALDQGSKLLMLFAFGFVHWPPGRSVSVLPFFNLVMLWNPGISYGLFPASSPIGTAALVVLSLLAIGGLGWWMWTSRGRTLAVGVGLVIGGALGNLIDRLVYGKVADFFHFYGFGYDWYVFNIADAAITFGAIAIIYDVLRPQTGDLAVGSGP